MSLRTIVRQLPIASPLAQWTFGRIAAIRFKGSLDYWQDRYRSGGTSGCGSHGQLAEFKAGVLNRFIAENKVESVVEFGCGAGSQAAPIKCPRYLGLDVSADAIESCKARCSGDPTKSFGLLGRDDPGTHELSLSLDVIYHLVEDRAFERHMTALFESAERYVIIYSSNFERRAPQPHVRHRRFTDWIETHRPDWMQIGVVKNAYAFNQRNPDSTSFADFYMFDRGTRTDLSQAA